MPTFGVECEIFKLWNEMGLYHRSKRKDKYGKQMKVVAATVHLDPRPLRLAHISPRLACTAASGVPSLGDPMLLKWNRGLSTVFQTSPFTGRES